MKAIGGRLVAGQDITAGDLSLGERVGQFAGGVASGAGAAAGAIVTTPFAIVDPQARRGYSDQWRGFGSGLDDALSSVRVDPKPRSQRATAPGPQASTTSSAGSSPSNSTRTR